MITADEKKLFNKQFKLRKPLYEKIISEVSPKVNVTIETNYDDLAWSRHEVKNKSTIHIGAECCTIIIKGSNRKVNTVSMRMALDEMFGHEYMHTLVSQGYLSTWQGTYEASVKHVFHNAVCDPYIELFAKFNTKDFSLYQRRQGRMLMKWAMKLSADYFFNAAAKNYKDTDEFGAFLNFMCINRTINFKLPKKYKYELHNKFYEKFPENKKYEAQFYNEHVGRKRMDIIDNWFEWIRSTNYFDFSAIDFMDMLMALLAQIFGKGDSTGEGLKTAVKEAKGKKEKDPSFDPLGDKPINITETYEPSPADDVESDDEVKDNEDAIAEQVAMQQKQDEEDSNRDDQLKAITGGNEGVVIIYD